MYTFAQKQKPTQKGKSESSARHNRAHFGQSRELSFIPHQQRTIGNQAVLRLLQSKGEEREDSSLTGTSPRSTHDFSQIPVHTSVQRSMQPKLKVSAPRDKYEQEADQVAARVVQQRVIVGGDHGKTGSQSKHLQLRTRGGHANQASNQIGEEPGTHNLKSQIEPGSNLGKPLDAGTNEEMSHKIGFDFSNVRIHTDDSAIYLNKGLNAKAFTHGTDIYFNKGKYNPNSSGGKRILAHELIHVVQQSRMSDKMIQKTSIDQIFNVFFSDFPVELLWVMPQYDQYTQIVRNWTPVINFVKKAHLALDKNCAYWKAHHMTNPTWKPKKHKGVDNAYPFESGELVPSPSGTDPITCAKEYLKSLPRSSPFNIAIQYTLAPLAKMGFFGPRITDLLHTCAIGSFRMYATVDRIDCNGKTAIMNFWMYNSMSRKSFGSFGWLTKFFSGAMSTQYMWWNWSEVHVGRTNVTH